MYRTCVKLCRDGTVDNNTDAHQDEREGARVYLLKGQAQQRADQFGQIQIHISVFDFVRNGIQPEKADYHAERVQKGEGADVNNHFSAVLPADRINKSLGGTS